MPKRSLAEAFQASLAEERAEEESRKEAKPPGDSDDGAEDYMSDALLERMQQQQQDADDTAARKRREQAEQAEAQRHADTSTALGRRQLKWRMPLTGEREARESGMATNLFDRVTGGESAGSGSQAAMQMMLAMGYKPGDSLGRSENDAPRQEPIRPDQRWLPQTPAETHRLGIGHADLSLRIETAAQRAAEERETKPESLEEFRMRSASEAKQRAVEGVLRKARRICRELDEEAGVKYSPLWLDPTCLPPGHALYQAPSIRGENERGLEEAQALLAYALVGEEEHEGPETKKPAEAEPSGRNDPEKPSRETEGSSQASPEPRQPAAARRVDAERFCSLNPASRLEVTHTHLRDIYTYCVYCGHRYASAEELETECPGLAEEDHD